MIPADVTDLQRRIDLLTRTAHQLRRHAPDLWSLGWEPTNNGIDDTGRVAGGQTDHSPKTGDPKARRLYERLTTDLAQMAAELVGYQRAMYALFYAGATSIDPSRGSLIPAAEHAQLLAKQQGRPDTPAKLIDQPTHPGANR